MFPILRQWTRQRRDRVSSAELCTGFVYRVHIAIESDQDTPPSPGLWSGQSVVRFNINQAAVLAHLEQDRVFSVHSLA